MPSLRWALRWWYSTVSGLSVERARIAPAGGLTGGRELRSVLIADLL
jgi:hypothetical protein